MYEVRIINGKKIKSYKKVCRGCQIRFETKNKHTIYHSARCAWEHPLWKQK